jgi:c-di-GMP-binding flagellar brake protein YcgR
MDLAWHFNRNNRRFDTRVPLEMHISTYASDRGKRALTFDISESGIYLQTLVQDPHIPYMPIGLEFELPGIPETIWALGEARRDRLDDYFYGLGVRFTRMASLHERMLADFCARQRRQGQTS